MVEQRLAAVNAHFKPSMISVNIKDAVATVVMDPPTKLIFLTNPLMEQLQQVFLELEKDPSVSVVILTGKGNSFATGASIAELKEQTLNSQMFNDYFERVWWRVVPKFRKPLIAAINGMAFGGGLELAMMADILIASDKATMGQPEINLGILPGSGGTVRLTSAVGKSKAMEMCLTGEPISAADAFKSGLVSQVVPHDKLMEAATTLAKKIASKSQVAAAMTKRAVKYALEVGESAAIDHERTLFIAAMATADKKEGTAAFMEKRKPKFTNN